MVVATLIADAYRNCGHDEEEEPSAAQYERGLRRLNSMLNAWSAEKLNVYGIVSGITSGGYALTPGDGEYTLGTGGNFNAAWAKQITSAFNRVDNVDYPLEIITRETYNAIPQKNLSQRPFKLYYEPTFPLGTIRLYPVPDQAYTVYFDAQKVITQFAAIEDEVALQPEFEEALEYNLSLRLAPKMGTALDPRVIDLARQSKAVISQQPVDPVQFDVFLGQGTFDINLGYSR